MFYSAYISAYIKYVKYVKYVKKYLKQSVFIVVYNTCEQLINTSKFRHKYVKNMSELYFIMIKDMFFYTLFDAFEINSSEIRPNASELFCRTFLHMKKAP